MNFILSAERKPVPCAVSLEIIGLHSYGGQSGPTIRAQKNQGHVQKQNLHLDMNAMDRTVLLPSSFPPHEIHLLKP